MCIAVFSLQTFWGFARVFSQTCSTFSSDFDDGLPDLVALHKQPPSFNFWYQIYLNLFASWCSFFQILHWRHSLGWVCASIFQDRKWLLFGKERHGATWKQNKNKTINLICFYTFCENLSLFHQEFPKLLACRMMSNFGGTPIIIIIIITTTIITTIITTTFLSKQCL